MEHAIDNNVDTVAEGVVGFTLATISHYTPNLIVLLNGVTIQSIDERVTLVFHVLSGIIATITLGDIIYKKIKARNNGKTNTYKEV
jgi:hypothetical protein